MMSGLPLALAELMAAISPATSPATTIKVGGGGAVVGMQAEGNGDSVISKKPWPLP